MRLIKNKKVVHLSMAAFMAVSGALSVGFAHNAHADALTKVQVRFDRMKQGTTTTGVVCATPSAGQLASTEGKVVVSFPTGFTVSTTTGDWTTNTTSNGWPAGAVAWPSIGSTASAAAAQDVTFASGDLTSSSTLYCFNWTTAAALTQPGSANGSEVGNVATQTSGGSGIDSAQYATATVSDDSVLVTATVPPVFTFSLNNNTDALGTLSTSSVKVGTATTATIGTNAKNGWTLWAKSANANGGLRSAAASYTIASTCNGGTQVGTNTTLSAGTEGYNTGVTGSSHAAGGSGAITVNTTTFDGTATGQGGGLCGNFQTIATSNGTAVGDTVTTKNNVAISAATAAATDYTDTITYVGAGLF
jgi:hypothetical protein